MLPAAALVYLASVARVAAIERMASPPSSLRPRRVLGRPVYPGRINQIAPRGDHCRFQNGSLCLDAGQHLHLRRLHAPFPSPRHPPHDRPSTAQPAGRGRTTRALRDALRGSKQRATRLASDEPAALPVVFVRRHMSALLRRHYHPVVAPADPVAPSLRRFSPR